MCLRARYLNSVLNGILQQLSTHASSPIRSQGFQRLTSITGSSDPHLKELAVGSRLESSVNSCSTAFTRSNSHASSSNSHASSSNTHRETSTSNTHSETSSSNTHSEASSSHTVTNNNQTGTSASHATGLGNPANMDTGNLSHPTFTPDTSARQEPGPTTSQVSITSENSARSKQIPTYSQQHVSAQISNLCQQLTTMQKRFLVGGKAVAGSSRSGWQKDLQKDRNRLIRDLEKELEARMHQLTVADAVLALTGLRAARWAATRSLSADLWHRLAKHLEANECTVAQQSSSKHARQLLIFASKAPQSVSLLQTSPSLWRCLATLASQDLHMLGSAEAVHMAMAMAGLRCGGSREWGTVVARLSTQGSMDGLALPLVVNAVAALAMEQGVHIESHTKKEMLSEASKQLLARQQELETPQELLVVAGSFAKLGYQDKVLASAVATRLLSSREEWRSSEEGRIAGAVIATAAALRSLMGNQLPPELPPVFTAVLDFATLSCMSLGARELTKALELCTLILPPLPSRPPLLGLGPQQVLGPQKGLDLQQDLGPVHSVNQPSSSHKRASPQPHGLDRSEGLPSTQPSSSRKSAPHQLPMLDQAVARLVQRACVQLRYEVGSLSLRDIVVVKEACSRTHQVDEPLHTAMSQRAEALLQQGRSSEEAGLHQVQRARPLQVSELDAGLLVRLALAVSTSGRSNPALLSSIADALLQAAPVAAESSSTLSPLPAGRLQAIPAQAASNSLSPLPQPHPSPEGHLQSIHPISSTLSPSPQPTHSVTDLAASLVTQLSPLSILQLLHAYQAAQHHAPHLFMAAGNALADMLASAAPASRQGVDMLDSAAQVSRQGEGVGHTGIQSAHLLPRPSHMLPSATQAARLASAFAQLGVSNPPLFDRLASLCAARARDSKLSIGDYALMLSAVNESGSTGGGATGGGGGGSGGGGYGSGGGGVSDGLSSLLEIAPLMLSHPSALTAPPGVLLAIIRQCRKHLPYVSSPSSSSIPSSFTSDSSPSPSHSAPLHSSLPNPNSNLDSKGLYSSTPSPLKSAPLHSSLPNSNSNLDSKTMAPASEPELGSWWDAAASTICSRGDLLPPTSLAELLGELAPRRGTATGEQHPGEEQQQLLGELAPRRGTATAARQVEQDYGAASGKSTAIADMAGKLLSSPEALQQLDSTQWQSALHALVQLGHSQTTTYANLGARGAALVRSSWSGAELVGALHAFASIPHASKPLMNTISRYLVLKSSSLQPEEVLCALEAMRDLAPPHDLKLFRALALSVHQKLGSYSTAQLLHIVAISLEMRLYHARLVTDVVRRYLSESSHPGVSPASITQLRDLALASSMGEPSDAVAIRKLGDQATLALCKPALSGEPGPTPLQLAELVWAFSGHASPHAELLEAAEAVLVSSIPELSTRAKLRVAQAYSHREARGSAGLVEALGRDVQKWLESLVVDHQPDRHAAELAPGASLLHWKPGGGWVPSGAPVGQDGDASECSLDPVGVMNQGSDKERLGRRHERGGMQLHGRLEEEEEEGWLEAADVPEGDYFSQVGVACSCSGQVDISFFTILATWAAGRAGAARSGQECSALSVALSSFLKFSAAAEALSPRWQGFGTANLGMCTPGQQLGGLQGGEDAAALAAVLNALHVLAQDARRLSSGWSDTTQLEQLIRGLATSVEQIEELQHQLQLQKNSSMKSDPSLDSTTDQLGDQIQQQISPSTSLDPASDPAICRIQHHVHSDSSSDKGGSDTDSRAPSVRGVDEENRFSLGMLADATWAEDKDSEALRDVRQALSGALQVVGNRLAIVLETRARYRQTRQYHKREF